MKRTAMLLIGTLRSAFAARLVLGLVGGVLLPVLSVTSLSSSARVPVPSEVVVLAAGSLAMTLAGEFIERYLFFTAVVAPRMPGSVHA